MSNEKVLVDRAVLEEALAAIKLMAKLLPILDALLNGNVIVTPSETPVETHEETSVVPVVQEATVDDYSSVNTDGWEDVLTRMNIPQEQWKESVLCITSLNPGITPEQYAQTIQPQEDSGAPAYIPSRSIPDEAVSNFNKWFPKWFTRSGFSASANIKACYHRLSEDYTNLLRDVHRMNTDDTDEVLFGGVMEPAAVEFAQLLVRTYGDNVNCDALRYLLTVPKERRVLGLLSDISRYMSYFHNVNADGFAPDLNAATAFQILYHTYTAEHTIAASNPLFRLTNKDEHKCSVYLMQMAAMAFANIKLRNGMMVFDFEKEMATAVRDKGVNLSMFKPTARDDLLTPERIRALAMYDKTQEWLKEHDRIPSRSAIGDSEEFSSIPDDALMGFIEEMWSLSKDELAAAKQEIQIAALRAKSPSLYRNMLERHSEDYLFNDTDREIVRFAKYVDTAMKALRGQQYYTSLPAHDNMKKMRGSDAYNKYHGLLDWLKEHDINPLTWVDAQLSRLTFKGVRLHHSTRCETIHSVLGFSRKLKVKEKSWAVRCTIAKGCAVYQYPEECSYEPSEKAIDIYNRYVNDRDTQVEMRFSGHVYSKAAYGAADVAVETSNPAQDNVEYTNSKADYQSLSNLLKAGSMMSDTAFEHLVTADMTKMFSEAAKTAKGYTGVPRSMKDDQLPEWFAAADHVDAVREVKYRTLYDGYTSLHPITALAMYWETGWADIVVQVTDALVNDTGNEYKQARLNVMDGFIDFAAEHKEWAARLKRIFHKVVKQVENKFALPSGWKKDALIEAFTDGYENAYTMACACT